MWGSQDRANVIGAAKQKATKYNSVRSNAYLASQDPELID